MIFSEPERTHYDLHFSLAGVPIRVHPFFWLVSVLLIAREDLDLPTLALWMIATFVSIVVHELGHALAFRYFGWSSHVVLYSFGGLAIPEDGFTPRKDTPASRMVVALAGPVAGFLLALVLIAGLYAAGYRLYFASDLFTATFGRGSAIRDLKARLLLTFMLDINIFWGLVNLLPVYPLDGGQIFRELLVHWRVRDPLGKSLRVSIGAAVCMAVVGLAVYDGLYVTLLFAYLAYMSYKALQTIERDRYGSW